MHNDESIIVFLEELSEKHFPQQKEEYSKKFLKEWEMYKKKSMATKSKSTKKSAPIKKAVIVFEEEEIPKKIAGCPHILTSGRRSGKPCGVKKVLENGFCARHKDSTILNKTHPDKIIKKHPALKSLWWNPKNEVAFEKKDGEFLAIGTITKIISGKSCTVIDFTDEEIEKFKNLGYKIDEDRVQKRKNKEKSVQEGNDDILVVEGDDLEDIVLVLPEKVTESPEEIAKEVSRILLGDIDDVLSEVKEESSNESEEEGEVEGEEGEGEGGEVEGEEAEEERDIAEWIDTLFQEIRTWVVSHKSVVLIESIAKLNKKQKPSYKLIKRKIDKIIETEEENLPEEVFEDTTKLSEKLADL